MTHDVTPLPLIEDAINLPSLFFKMASMYPHRVVYSQARHANSSIQWPGTTYRECSERIVRLARGFASLGVNKGDRVAIVCGTRPEWLELDLALLSLGAVTVAVYPSLPAAEIGYILFDSGARIVVAENEEQLQKLKRIAAEPQVVPAREGIEQLSARIILERIITLEETTDDPLKVSVTSLLDAPGATPSAPDTVHLVSRTDIASFVYTSGTTGPSKGVIQTHGNHLSNVWQATKSGMFALDGELFLYLPLAHSFARLIGYLGFLTPAQLTFASVADRKTSRVDLKNVATELRESNAHVLPTVPRLLEKVQSGIEEKASAGGIGGLLLRLTLSSARAVWRDREAKRSTPLATSLTYALTSPLRQKIKRGIFGTRFLHAISGGAKLPVDVNEFFWGLGIKVYEGYGLTETCVATNVNRTDRNRIGSVGPALAGVETRIAEDGEICFRGPNITQGYWNRPQATADSWDHEGWFHTGDIGHLDDDGFLFITDRKKDLIVTAGGKKVPPLKVETLLVASRYISQALYCGDGKPYCVALVTLNQDVVKEELSRKGVRVSEPLSKDAHVQSLLESVREGINKQLSSFEEVKKIGVIDEELTIDNGMLTPTLKIKRKVVLHHYRDLFDSLYEGRS